MGGKSCMFANPCNECIVRAMCQNECNNLREYLQCLFPYTDRTTTYIARQMRLGLYQVIDNNLWRVYTSGKPSHIITKGKAK